MNEWMNEWMNEHNSYKMQFNIVLHNVFGPYIKFPIAKLSRGTTEKFSGRTTTQRSAVHWNTGLCNPSSQRCVTGNTCRLKMAYKNASLSLYLRHIRRRRPTSSIPWPSQGLELYYSHDVQRYLRMTKLTHTLTTKLIHRLSYLILLYHSFLS